MVGTYSLVWAIHAAGASLLLFSVGYHDNRVQRFLYYFYIIVRL